MRTTSLSLWALAFAAGFGGTGALAETDHMAAVEAHVSAIEDKVAQEIQGTISPQERERHEIIIKAMQAKDNEGTWQALAGRTVVMLSERGAADLALKNGLAIKVTQANRDIVDLVIEQAEAAFNPVFNLNVGYNNYETFRRSRLGLVAQKNFEPYPPYFCVDVSPLNPQVNAALVTNACTNNTNTHPSVIAIGFLNQPKQSGVPHAVVASPDSPNGPTVSDSFTVSLEQQLPWGPTFSISHTTVVRDDYYKNGYRYGGRDTTADAYINLSTPLPFTAGFGELSPVDAAIAQGKIGREQAEWQLKLVLNSLLASADGAYWDLVSSLESLYAAQKNLELVQQERDRVQHQYDMRLATEYTLAQAQAEYLRAEVDLEGRRNTMMAASQALGQIVDDTAARAHTTVYLPYGYTGQLDDWMKTSYDKALADARANRPDLRLQEANHKAADLSVAVADNQTLPRINASAALAASENNTVIGFKDVIDATSNLGRPDTLTRTLALNYSYAWGNNGVEAALEIAKLGLAGQVINEDLSEATMLQELHNGLANLDGTRATATFSKHEVERLEVAYGGLSRKMAAGGQVTQHEIILTARDLLSARTGYIQALTSNKKAESALLASEGVLPSQFGERTAVSDFDRDRLRRLASAGVINLFKPAETTGKN